MTDRLPNDHPSIETYRITLDRRGRLDRPRLDLSGVDASLPVGEVVRLTMDGQVYHARITESFDGAPEIRGAYDNPRLARESVGGTGGSEGTDHLAAWRTAKELDFGRSVLFDVVVSEFAYGLRAPGERAAYEATRPPDDGLRHIARSLDDN